jgi:hypothetical protein
MLVVVGLVLAVSAGGRLVLAAADAFDLAWWTVDGGGGTSAGGSYSVSGTLGQPVAASGVAALSGGPYQLSGGFWAQSATPFHTLFLPVVVSQN